LDITEHAIDSETLESIAGCAIDAAEMLHLDLESLTAAEIVNAVDNCVFSLQKGGGPKIPEVADPALTLGSLWGQQLVRELGWTWANVTFHKHEDSQAVGVFSPDRALAIYPFHFIWGCLENDASVTILLAYSMLKDGSRIPSLPTNAFENVMDNVHHIVPRE